MGKYIRTLSFSTCNPFKLARHTRPTCFDNWVPCPAGNLHKILALNISNFLFYFIDCNSGLVKITRWKERTREQKNSTPTDQTLQRPAVCLWRVTGPKTNLLTSMMNLDCHIHSMWILLYKIKGGRKRKKKRKQHLHVSDCCCKTGVL